jgi:hypothetical protein
MEAERKEGFRVFGFFPNDYDPLTPAVTLLSFHLAHTHLVDSHISLSSPHPSKPPSVSSFRLSPPIP